jgi:hypothetical protein
MEQDLVDDKFRNIQNQQKFLIVIVGKLHWKRRNADFCHRKRANHQNAPPNLIMCHYRS